jgi:hypothetical protein
VREQLLSQNWDASSRKTRYCNRLLKTQNAWCVTARNEQQEILAALDQVDRSGALLFAEIKQAGCDPNQITVPTSPPESAAAPSPAVPPQRSDIPALQHGQAAAPSPGMWSQDALPVAPLPEQARPQAAPTEPAPAQDAPGDALARGFLMLATELFSRWNNCADKVECSEEAMAHTRWRIRLAQAEALRDRCAQGEVSVCEQLGQWDEAAYAALECADTEDPLSCLDQPVLQEVDAAFRDYPQAGAMATWSVGLLDYLIASDCNQVPGLCDYWRVFQTKTGFMGLAMNECAAGDQALCDILARADALAGPVFQCLVDLHDDCASDSNFTQFAGEVRAALERCRCTG